MSSTDTKCVKVCTRSSPLALAQTNHVIQMICSKSNDIRCEIEELKTVGDKILDKPLSKIGDKGLFTQELEQRLLQGLSHIAVHSLKDVQTVLPDGLCIGAILKRENPCDVVIFRNPSKYKSIDVLPEGSIIGTSSLRRKATLQNKFPKLKFTDIRGNVGTRLGKLNGEEKKYDAIVLAYAGLLRLGMESKMHQKLEDEEYFHAVGQGALAVQCRNDDQFALQMLKGLHDDNTDCLVSAERSMLLTLEGGCHVPIAVHSEFLNGDKDIRLRAIVYSEDGTIVGKGEATESRNNAVELGKIVAYQAMEGSK